MTAIKRKDLSLVSIGGFKRSNGRYVTSVYNGKTEVCSLLPKGWNGKMPTIEQAYDLINS